MVGVAFATLSDHHLAEDAAQEAFVVAARQLRALRRPEKFAAWMRVLCRNTARKLGRRRTVSAVLDDVPVPPNDDSEDGVHDAVWNSIRRLPTSGSEVLMLKYFSGLSYEQIAATLGISTRAVHGRLLRAKRRIAHDVRRNGFERRTQ